MNFKNVILLGTLHLIFYLIVMYIRTVEERKKLYRHVLADTEICKYSEYGAVFSNAYIRPQVSGAGIRSVTTVTVTGAGIRSFTAATVTGYHDLSEFELGVIVSTREIGHSISEVAMGWGFFHMTI